MKRIQGKNVKAKLPHQSTPEGEASAVALTEAIDAALTPSNEPTHKKITGFHPSSITNNCRRYWFLMFEGAEVQKSFGPRIQRIFDNGHDVHSRYRDYFDSMGILVDDEVPVRLLDPVPIRGYADGIIQWGGDKPYEMKSISPTRFEFRRLYNKPDEKTMRQFQIYLNIMDYDDGFVIYEEKGSQNLLIFHVKRDEVAYAKEIKRLKGIYKNVLENTRPARPYKRNSTQCSQCDILNYCWDRVPD